VIDRDPRLSDDEWAYALDLIRDGIPADTAADIALFERVGPDVAQEGVTDGKPVNEALG